MLVDAHQKGCHWSPRQRLSNQHAGENMVGHEHWGPISEIALEDQAPVAQNVGSMSSVRWCEHESGWNLCIDVHDSPGPWPALRRTGATPNPLGGLQQTGT